MFADTLTGDLNGKAAGSTSVTARVELPEDYDSSGFDENGGYINTGDDTQIMMYICMILISGIVIVSVLRVNQKTK